MSDLLVRIPFTEESDFTALALAPGLPMLDGRKLAYQVLLGWFGDMLAEPELGDHGVNFFVQSRGKRQEIAEHALATQRDLDGHLAGDFERLRKALFDVKPVSPSERLIFNRLQPPIGNFDGFLYRVRPAGSSDRLVWCWGYQRRHSDGDAFLCPHADCSLLFIRHDTSLDTCPRCERPLFDKQVVAHRRTTFPIGAAAATVVLGGLVGATYWIASVSGDESLDAIPALAAVSPPELDDDTADADSQDTAPADVPVTSESSTQESEASLNDAINNIAPSTDIVSDAPGNNLPATDAESDNDANQPESREPRRLDLPLTSTPFDERQPLDYFPPKEEIEKPQPTSTPRETRPAPQQPALPEPAQRNVVEELDPPKPEPATTTQPESAATIVETPSDPAPTTSPKAAADWSTDYVASYQQAITERRFLIMLFRDPADEETQNVDLADLPAAGEIDALAECIRVVVPTTMSVPGQPEGSTSRLLDHRSFRHLQKEPGLAVVDLTSTDSPNFGRVVSAFPGASQRDTIAEALKPALSLPAGTISQRSLLLSLQTDIENSRFANRTYGPLLNELANRNSRYMAHLEQPGLFEAEQRRAAVRKQYGEGVQLQELVFATNDSATIQDAARQAVAHWLANDELTSSNEQVMTAFGLELFQSPSSNRWFATLLIVLAE